MWFLLMRHLDSYCGRMGSFNVGTVTGSVNFFPTLVPGSSGQRPFSANKFAGL